MNILRRWLRMAVDVSILWLILFSTLSGAEIGLVANYGFEPGESEDWVLDYRARVASEPKMVISGKSSLYCSIMDSGRKWNEFFKIDPAKLPLEPKGTYTIYFQYRILDKGEETQFYFQIHSVKGAIDKGWTTIGGEPGTTGSKTVTVTLDDYEDYSLRFGIRVSGAIAIDDVKVFQGKVSEKDIAESAAKTSETEKKKKDAGPDLSLVKEPIDVGSRKQLFIDTKFVETERGITLRMNPPVKMEPLALSVHPTTGYLSLVEYGGQYYLYYDSGKGYSVAVSTDGIRWVNPDLGTAGQNCSLVFPGCNEGGVFLDPKAKDGFPFKAIFGVSSGENPNWGSGFFVGPYMEDKKFGVEGALYLFRSKDGFKWEVIPKIAVPFSCDSGNQVLYDPGLD